MSRNTTHHTSKGLSPKIVEKVKSKGLSKNQLIVTGILTIATVCGVLFYRHVSKKNRLQKEALQSVELNHVGVCIKCGEPLNESTYNPGSVTKNDTDACIICKNCGEKNFARYPDENDLL